MKKITLRLFMLSVLLFCFTAQAQFTESFEGTGTPAGWTVINQGSAPTWEFTVPNGGAANSGTQVAQISFGDIAHDDYLITPQFTVTADLSDRLTLFSRNRGSGSLADEFNILISTTGNAATDFTETLAGPLVPIINVYTRYQYELSAYEGQDIYIAIQAISTDKFRLFIDDVTVDANPACPEVQNFDFTDATLSTATFTWDAVSDATNGYILSIFDEGADPSTDTPVYTEDVAAGTLTATATGLADTTTYDAYLTSDCAAAGASTAAMITFDTAFPQPACGGKFFDTGGPNAPFQNNELYDTTISPDSSGDVVTATFIFLDNGAVSTTTGNQFDVLTVDIGDGNGPQVIPNIPAGSTPLVYTSVAADGALLFNFDSSGVTQNPGWEADITCEAPASNTFDCGQMQVSNAFENGSFIEQGGGQRVSNDIVVGINTTSFALNNITANLFSQGGIESVDITFFEDNNGLPGAQFGTTIEDLVPTSQAIIGTAFGFDAQEVVLDLSTPVDFPGTGMGEVRYWIQLVAVPNTAGTRVAWETTTLNTVGLPLAFVNDTAGGTYTINPDGADGVFTTSGDCTQAMGCLAPENLVVSNITDTTADISWDAETVATDGYIVSVFNAGDDPDTDTPIFTENVATGTLTSTATGLTGSTMYDAYVASDCGGSTSVRNMKVFETGIAPPVCGGKFYDTGGPSGDYQNDENYSVTIVNNDPNNLISLEFLTVDVEGAPFDILRIYDGDDATAPELSDPTDGVTAPGIFTSNTPGGNLFVTFISDVSVSLAGWDANVICNVAPSCLPVSNITFSNITETTATINWQDSNSASNGYIVEVFDAGDDPATDNPVFSENVAAGTFTSNATGLTGSSSYDAYVTADCGGGDLSAPVMATFDSAVSPPACGGKFYDTGGPNGDFENNELYDVTILPDTSGDVVTATFVFVNNTSFDVLTVDIGDGNLQVVPEIPMNGTPISYTSIAADGSLVFNFDSSGVVPNAGWDADITCGPRLGVDGFNSTTLSMYPNPVENILYLKTELPINKVEVYNIVGQKIFDLKPNDLEAELDFSNLRSGVFILKADVDGKTITRRVIKK